MSHPEHVVTARNGKLAQTVPDPEVKLKAQRRQFNADYKRRILAEVDACRAAGQIGALLRREGLYSSHLTTWRRQQAEGGLQGLAPRKRGRKADPLVTENATLQRQVERLQAQLERAETIIDVQKKLSQVLGLTNALDESGEPL